MKTEDEFFLNIIQEKYQMYRQSIRCICVQKKKGNK